MIDAKTRAATEFRAKTVFLCASALESVRILLNSSTTEFPNGLGNSSGELGHNLMDHVKTGGAMGTIPGNENRVVIGRRPNGMYIPRFRNVKTKQSGFLRGYGFEGGAHREGWERESRKPDSARNSRSRCVAGTMAVYLRGYGECLPNHNNYVELDKEHTDAWGIPVRKTTCSWSDNELALGKDMAITAAEMLAAAGAHDIEPFAEDQPPGFAIHEMGTARMGRDPKTSVLNPYNQAHDVRNIFITEGGAMTSSSCVNPSLTYMALTARACDYAVQQLKKGDL